MGRSPSFFSSSKHEEGLNRGAWTPIEDKILSEYIESHGACGWTSLPKKAGLKRFGKGCRLRWLNYLRPDIKQGNISAEEEELLIRLHRLLGNRSALVAGQLPGRTDNELKNYWNTQFSKRVQMGEFEPKFQNSLKRKSMPSYSNYSCETLPLKPTAVRYCGRAVVDAVNLENCNYDHVPDTHDVIHEAADYQVVEIDTTKSWCQFLLEDCYMGDYRCDGLEAIDSLEYDSIMSTSNGTDDVHLSTSPSISRSIILEENHSSSSCNLFGQELPDMKDLSSSYIDSFLDLGMPCFLLP